MYFIVRPQYKKGSSILDDDKIYGVVWDGSSTTAWTRTDDAVNFSDPVPQMKGSGNTWTDGSSPFDNIMPWAGMVRSEDEVAGTLVAIPKFYFKLEYANPSASVKGLKIQISRQQFTGSQISPAHMDRGDGKGERDVIYIGRYHCAKTTYKSTSGVKPQADVKPDNLKYYVNNLGADIWQMDFATWTTIQFLYLVEFADWDSQAKIGYGCGKGSVVNMGTTDAMTYHTGTTETNRTTYGFTQYRNIEDLWGNVFDFICGIYFSSNYLYISKKLGDTGEGTRLFSHNDGGYIKGFQISTNSDFKWVMYPSTFGGSNSTYVTDYYSGSSSSYRFLFGGFADGYSQNYGLFYYSERSSNSYGDMTGTRLIKAP